MSIKAKYIVRKNGWSPLDKNGNVMLSADGQDLLFEHWYEIIDFLKEHHFGLNSNKVRAISKETWCVILENLN